LPLLLLVFFHHPQIHGCPIHRAFCDGWDDKCSLNQDAAAVAFLLPTKRPVISTGAAHGIIVSSAAEKSASLPKQHLSHCPVFAVAVALVLAVACFSPAVAFACPLSPSNIHGCPIHRAFCDGWDDKCTLNQDAVVVALLLPTTETVISTEAAHGLIVSSAAEKSASLPNNISATALSLRLLSYLPLSSEGA
jgi:hypothetical protein